MRPQANPCTLLRVPKVVTSTPLAGGAFTRAGIGNDGEGAKSFDSNVGSNTTCGIGLRIQM